MAAAERMLKLAEVEAMLGRKRTWIYSEVQAHRFPPPDDGRWYLSEVNRYLRIRRMGGEVAGVWTLRGARAA